MYFIWRNLIRTYLTLSLVRRASWCISISPSFSALNEFDSSITLASGNVTVKNPVRHNEISKKRPDFESLHCFLHCNLNEWPVNDQFWYKSDFKTRPLCRRTSTSNLTFLMSHFGTVLLLGWSLVFHHGLREWPDLQTPPNATLFNQRLTWYLLISQCSQPWIEYKS